MSNAERRPSTRRAPRGGRRSATPVAGTRRSWRARGCRTRAPRPGATGARARRTPPLRCTRRCRLQRDRARRRACAPRRRARSRSSRTCRLARARRSRRDGRAVEHTMPSATRSSCCRATARRHIVASKLRPPCGPRLIRVTIVRAPCALAALALLAPARSPSPGALAGPPPTPEAAAWIVAAPGRGGVLLQHAPRAQREVASLTKLMTAHLVLRYARLGRSSPRAAMRSRWESRACRCSSASARRCTHCWLR